jgi:hypothetical protein
MRAENAFFEEEGVLALLPALIDVAAYLEHRQYPSAAKASWQYPLHEKEMVE